MTSQKVASLYAELRLEDTMTPALGKAQGELKSMGADMVKWGQLTADAYKVGIDMAKNFASSTVAATTTYDRNFSNIRAITGQTSTEINALKNDVSRLSNEFLATPIEASQAYYDIVGGVQDVTQHMPMLRQAMLLSDATTADLDTTTKAMIATMNAYEMQASQATLVTDIYNRVVQMGVGSGQEFVSALSPLGGVAKSAGVGFEELGTAIAFQTTKGFTASTAANNTAQAINKLLAPSGQLSKLYRQLGIESGQTAIEQYGLAGTIQMIDDAIGGSQEQWIKLLGTQEAVKAAVALSADSYDGFAETFSAGVDGSALKSQSAALDNAAAQWDMLTGKVQSYQIAVGNLALPMANEGLTTLNFIADVIFDPQSIADKANSTLNEAWAAQYLKPIESTYTIKAGDTAQDVADALGITLAQAQALIRAQGGFISVGVDPTLDGFAAALGTTRDEAKRIAQASGWDVSVPTTITPQMVLDELAKRGLGRDAYEVVKTEMENQAAGGVRVNVPTTLTPQVIQDFATANNMGYAQAEAFLTNYFGDRQYSTKLKTGVTITAESYYTTGLGVGQISAAVYNQPEVKELTSGQKRIAMAVSLGLSVKEAVTGTETSEADTMKIYEAAQTFVDKVGAPAVSVPMKIAWDIPTDALSATMDLLFDPDSEENKGWSTAIDGIPTLIDAFGLKLETAILGVAKKAGDGVNDIVNQLNTLAGAPTDLLSSITGVQFGGLDFSNPVDTGGIQQRIDLNNARLQAGMPSDSTAVAAQSGLGGLGGDIFGAVAGATANLGEMAPEIPIMPTLVEGWQDQLFNKVVGEDPVNIPINMDVQLTAGMLTEEQIGALIFADEQQAREMLLQVAIDTGEMPEELLNVFTSDEIHVIDIALDEGLFEQTGNALIDFAAIQTYAEDPMLLTISNPDVFKNLKAEADAATANRAMTVDVYVNVHTDGAGTGRAEAIQAGSDAFSMPQYAEGGWTGSGGVSMLHPEEYVVPSEGLMVKPTPQGLVADMAGGGGGGGVQINGPVTVQGVTNPREFYDEMAAEARRRGG